MKTTKSKAAYTTKWLNRNKQHWCEKAIRGVMQIVIKKPDAPKIVFDRVKEINEKRRLKDDPAGKLLSAIGLMGKTQKAQR